ncbi:type 11 methyltransferase [Calothrix sp. NIES-4071]|nr:type 11 methyltransferase [Calothrix sp. NIES-4071]BAZ56058.1 type 11 methyltransferase [Calothrix sp. NIES-4105]
MITNDLSGAWTPDMYETHLPDCVAFDEGLIKYIIELIQPKKSLDLGCGLGYFIKYLRDNGIDAWGVEGENLSNFFKAPGYQIVQDISQPFNLNEVYDLVMCLEVVEHIPREFEDIVFDNIVNHMSRYLLFSGATPGQQGTGHVNERQESYWFSHLTRRGLVLKHQETLNARSSSTLSWYVNNVSLWEMPHPRGFNYYDLIGERDSHILRRETILNNLQNRFNQSKESLEHLQLQLQQVKSELENSQTQRWEAQIRIAAMESSKFWKLRTQWMKVKKIFTGKID